MVNWPYDILLSCDPWYQRDEVFRIVGTEAFEYGILIGQEDFRLMDNPLSDVFIMFPHRSIQEFFGSFYITKSLGSSNNPPPLFLIDVSVLQFCCWLAHDESLDKTVGISNAYERIQDEFLRRYNLTMLDLLVENRLVRPFTTNDQILSKFWSDMLSKCTDVRHLLLSAVDPIRNILEALGSITSDLASVWIIDKRYKKLHVVMDTMRRHFFGTGTSILLQTESLDEVDGILAQCSILPGCPSVVFLKSEKLNRIDIASFMKPGMGKLCLRDELLETDVYCSLTSKYSTQSGIPKCPRMTHLSVSGYKLEYSATQALCKAANQGNLPVLTHLSFAHCRPAFTFVGRLPILFRCKWPSLTHLNLNNCQLNVKDLQTISACLADHDKGLLPKLTSLVLYFGDILDKLSAGNIMYDEESRLYVKWDRNVDLLPLSNTFTVPLPGITKLSVHEVSKEEYNQLVELLNNGLCPNLIELSILMWKYVDLHTNVQIPVHKLMIKRVPYITFQAYGFTERLQSVNVSTLNNLILHRAVRTEEHLIALTRSTCMTNLHKLDISKRPGLTGNLSELLRHSFPTLNSLILSDCGLNSQDLCSLTQANVEGRIPLLKHLDISVNSYLQGRLNQLFTNGCKWQKLVNLNVACCCTRSFEYLQLKVKSGCLEPLQELKFSAEVDISQHGDSVWPFLNSLHVCSLRFSSQELVTVVSRLVEGGAFPALNLLNVHTQLLAADPAIRSIGDQLHKSLVEKFDSKIAEEVQEAVPSALFTYDRLFHEQHSHSSGYCELSNVTEYDNQIQNVASTVTNNIISNLETYKSGSKDDRLFPIVQEYFAAQAPYFTRRKPGQPFSSPATSDYYGARHKLTKRGVVVFENVLSDFDIGW